MSVDLVRLWRAILVVAGLGHGTDQIKQSASARRVINTVVSADQIHGFFARHWVVIKPGLRCIIEADVTIASLGVTRISIKARIARLYIVGHIFKEKTDRHREQLAQMKQAAGPDAVGAALIFLDLLKG